MKQQEAVKILNENTSLLHLGTCEVWKMGRWDEGREDSSQKSVLLRRISREKSVIRSQKSESEGRTFNAIFYSLRRGGLPFT
ncbi:MAG: hypothetical protein WC879_18145 [Melioribacteraceae bacterium]